MLFAFLVKEEEFLWEGKKKRWICEEEEFFLENNNGRGIYIDIYYKYIYILYFAWTLCMFSMSLPFFFFVDNSVTH